jgi:sec-independent protein translocase protein TatC
MDDDGKMTFSQHLEELRTRLIRSVAAIIAAMVITWNFREAIFAWLTRPLEVAWLCRSQGSCTARGVFNWMLHPAVFQRAQEVVKQRLGLGAIEPSVHFLSPTGGFTSYIKIAAIAGCVLALPVVFYQLWGFIAPGLYPREKRFVIPFTFASTLFFVAGALFGYHFVFPVGHEFFLGFSGTLPGTHVVVKPMITMEEYLDFTTSMLLAFGVVFELPLFVFFLSLAGIVTWQQLLKFGRYFTVIAFVVAAVLTPTPDVYSQVMLALPLVVLYFVATGLAFLLAPKGRKTTATVDTPKPAPALPALAAKIVSGKPLAKPVGKPSPQDVAAMDAIRAEKIRRHEEEIKRAKEAKS